MGKYASWKYGECECSGRMCACSQELGPAVVLVRRHDKEIRVCTKCFCPKEWAGIDLTERGGMDEVVRVLVEDHDDPMPLLRYDPRGTIIVAMLQIRMEDAEKSRKQANIN